MLKQAEANTRTPLSLFHTGFAEPQEVEANAERIKAARERLQASSTGPGSILVVHGANEDILELGGQTVGMIRRDIEGLSNIHPQAVPFINGKHVIEGYVLRHGETLEFLAPFGRKGVGRVWTQEEFCELFQMCRADLEAMLERGLPVHRLEDGSVRITETDFDRWTEREEPWLLTACDFAARLHISERELWRMRSSGKLPSPVELGPKLIRWDRSEILDWIDAACPCQKSWDLLKAKRPKARSPR